MRGSFEAIHMDFAEANQWVFYGMAIALGLACLCTLLHPGTRVTGENGENGENTETEGATQERTRP